MKKFIFLLFAALFFQIMIFAQDSQPVKILEKPHGILKNDEIRKINISGTVAVRVEFLASGGVGQVDLVRGLPFGFSDAAVDAAKKIKFEPATKNGVPATVYKVIEYGFSWISGGDFVFANENLAATNEKAEAVLKKAVERLGGERYLAVKTVIGRGNFTRVGANELPIPAAFLDYIVYPDKERTEFKTGGEKTIQTNTGETGWIADTATRSLKDQTPEQIAGFKQGFRTSLDYLLRGAWRTEKAAMLEYVGRREATLGKRNEVVRLTLPDGLSVEFEFAAHDGTPAKSIYKLKNGEGEESTEEDRFAQFVQFNGVFAPLIIDHYRNGKQTSRINYESIEFNKPIDDALFTKPADIKKIK